jgi:predicted N-acetyltransferase YhbS
VANIRNAGRVDAAECCNLAESDGVSYWRQQDFEASAEEAIFLVAEDGGHVIGYVLGFILPTKESEALVHETRVKVEERGKGIGKDLVDAFCEEAFRRGVEIVLAEIEPEHLEFYRDRCGFVKKGSWIEVGRPR